VFKNKFSVLSKHITLTLCVLKIFRIFQGCGGVMLQLAQTFI